MARKTYNGPTAEEKLVSDLADLMDRSDLPPWQKPWTPRNGKHRNLLTGHEYSGSNPILLEMGAIMGGHQGMPLWIGYGAAKSKGWLPRKGCKGVRILRPQLNVREDEGEDGADPVIKSWVSYKVVCVFNAADLVGVDDKSSETLEAAIRTAIGSGTDRPESQRLDAAEAVLGAWPVETTYGGSVACYVPSLDTIRMPDPSDFRSREAFCATWAHEQAHSTGHESRLKRTFGGAFGSQQYAREELIAELAAVLICLRLEIGYDLQGHAAYLKHWTNILRDEPKALFKVLSAARQAADLIAPETATESADLAD